MNKYRRLPVIIGAIVTLVAVFSKCVQRNGGPSHEIIAEDFENYPRKLPKEIYLLAAEACQMDINEDPRPPSIYYHNMAKWYWRGGDRTRAIEAEKKGIEVLKKERNFTSDKLGQYESRLKLYRGSAARLTGGYGG